MIDNINIIKNLLNFEIEGDFYMLYVFKRKKDQPEDERSNHQSVRTIKTYCVDSIEYLDKRYDEIKLLCEVFKARAYIHVQKQNHKDVSLDLMSELVERIKSNSFNQKNIFDSVVGQLKTYEKRWIVDIDNKDDDYVNKIILDISKLKPEGDKVEHIVPTKNGYHLITKKFDMLNFSKQYPGLDVQKRNPTLLYFPESLEKN
jgi:hypothetical protein